MEIDSVLNKLGIEALNEMQQSTINASVANDVVLLAPTGTGKTLAYLIPILRSLQKEKSGIQALVLAPSRELALQIEKVFRSMGTGFKVTCCYGGHSTRIERHELTEAPALLIGTPGRIADHIRRNHINTATIEFLVLDEFDKSLELGFQGEMSSILHHLTGINKRILTSATKAVEIPEYSGIRKHKELNYLTLATPASLNQYVVQTEGRDKSELLYKLICTLDNEPTLVFCNHRDTVFRVGALLDEKGISCGLFHGGLEQDERERALIKFRNGSVRILVTTDLASRGLDIPDVQHVVHYQLAPTAEAFTHRNGRTARMFAGGNAWLVMAEGDYLPEYIIEKPEIIDLPEVVDLPAEPVWETLYIGGGRKEKISKVDVVGFLIQQGGLAKDEIGLIEVLDHNTFVAINRAKAKTTVKKVLDIKFKGRKIKISIAE